MTLEQEEDVLPSHCPPERHQEVEQFTGTVWPLSSVFCTSSYGCAAHPPQPCPGRQGLYVGTSSEASQTACLRGRPPAGDWTACPHESHCPRGGAGGRVQAEL